MCVLLSQQTVNKVIKGFKGQDCVCDPPEAHIGATSSKLLQGSWGCPVCACVC
jgi:hypothetical protein